MISKIVYILGILIAVLCVLDIWKKNLTLVKKILLCVLVLMFSWVGAAVYYFVLRDRI